MSGHLRTSTNRDTRAIEVLRVGIGVVWALNLLFVVDPSNQFFPTFSSTALSFAPSTLGGPALAQFAAAHAYLFAWLVAGITTYLAIAFLLGLTTRVATLVGAAFSAILLLTQFGSTFFFPGGTDVGPHPLYLLIYATLWIGGAGQTYALDAWFRARVRGARPASLRKMPSQATPET
jgi:uncharacterized membrane protein YphA (DoxX/SURF4 family)